MADVELQVREVQSIRAVLAHDVSLTAGSCPTSTTATRHSMRLMASVDALAEAMEQHQTDHHARNPNG